MERKTKLFLLFICGCLAIGIVVPLVHLVWCDDPFPGVTMPGIKTVGRDRWELLDGSFVDLDWVGGAIQVNHGGRVQGYVIDLSPALVIGPGETIREALHRDHATGTGRVWHAVPLHSCLNENSPDYFDDRGEAVAWVLYGEKSVTDGDD